MRENEPMAVVIVSYNTRYHLQRCLQAVFEQDVRDVVVVDNGSTDESIEMVRSMFPTVNLCITTENRGYGAAANQGVAASKCKRVLVLNSDTVVLPGCMEALEAVLDAYRAAGIVGPRLENPDGSLQPSTRPFPTPLHVLLLESSLNAVVGRLPGLHSTYLLTWPHDSLRDVPWCVGAALAVRREAFDRVGGFDESFFMYFEETDLSLRMAQAGWTTYFAPKARVTHVGGASASQQWGLMSLQLYASLRQFYRVHYGPVRMMFLRFVLTYLMARNMVLDVARLGRTHDSRERSALRARLGVWRRVLLQS